MYNSAIISKRTLAIYRNVSILIELDIFPDLTAYKQPIFPFWIQKKVIQM